MRRSRSVVSDSLRPPWMVACQAPPSIGFSSQEYWSGLPFPSAVHESEVAQLCLTPCDLMDCSPPNFSVHGILQARILKWVAISFSGDLPKPRQHTKSGDIILPTKVHLVKAIVFPVVMYGCESWTRKKAKCQRMLLNCGVGEGS